MSLANKRWQILREALLNHRVEANEDFTGFNNLLETEKVAVDDNGYDLFVVDSENFLESLEECVLAHQALFPSAESATLRIQPSDSYNNIPEDTLSLAREKLNLASLCFNQANQSIQVTYQSRVGDYIVRKYSVKDREVLVREPQYVKVTLDELISHRKTVDNTGNVRLWDCAKILAWALQYEEESVVESVTEIGAGMAGIAALSSNHSSRITITDGHPDCILNNRVNVRLMKSANLLQGRHVDCRLLKWTLDERISIEPAERVLVSDCTHFQHYHKELLWTITQCAKVGGCIWMCQPQRNGSLNNFLRLVERWNGSDAIILEVKERTYSQLIESGKVHEKDPRYDKERHFPLIFVLQKLRETTSDDLERLKDIVKDEANSR